ncbi:AAA family ATPase [Kineothrix sp. MSJ-39]|uniref:ATP-binding protein n=1 Tax=Kineothrix sp. MSJ-39 TaxID=2841533 RepID=UPI001C11D27E|nr:AAA family ATPase [Kineothrix sp. MSJ-39]MBU5428925.1 AAA family ATPase [Kineothrix sp. MSJ-39]
MYKRKIYDQLLHWKNTSNGKTAVLIEGPRRVGKSTVVEEFAKNEYESYIIVDFYRASSATKQLFDDLSDLNYIFLQLQLTYQTSLQDRKSCIVFDEVQLCPKARQAIKALVKDGRYDYIETGSLISIHKNVKDILIPSEERKLHMYPMDYEEFRWALEDTISVTMLKQFYDAKRPLGQAANRKMLRDFRLYMLVGGMPQAVESYIETNDLRKVDEIKRDILTLYEDDFRKIDSTGKISALFDAIPAQLMGNAARYQVSSVLSGNRAGDILEQIAELKDSGTVLVAYHANDLGAGMAQNKDLERFKLFIADIGLFVTLAFKDRSFTENDIYSRLLNDTLQANLGYLYENVIAQTLATNGHELYYHTFLNAKTRHNYEIVFLITEKNKICPIEVKSSGYKSHASIDAFSQKFSSKIIRKIMLYTKDYMRDGDMECIPVYMAQFL